MSADYASVGAVNVDVKSIFGPAGLSILDITMRGLGLITSAPMTASSTFAVIAAMLPACIFFVPCNALFAGLRSVASRRVQLCDW